MGRARLTRIDAVQAMAAAVDAFRNEASAALETLDMEIRRTSDWIHHDRHDHWNHQVRRGWDKITEARVQLQQAKTARRIDAHDPACIDEKKALARAKQRLEIAQEKVEAVRHCTRAIDRAVDEYRGARTPISGWLEAEIPKALAALRRMMDNLEDYLAVQAPGGGMAEVLPIEATQPFAPIGRISPIGRMESAEEPAPVDVSEEAAADPEHNGGLKPTVREAAESEGDPA